MEKSQTKTLIAIKCKRYVNRVTLLLEVYVVWSKCNAAEEVESSKHHVNLQYFVQSEFK